MLRPRIGLAVLTIAVGLMWRLLFVGSADLGPADLARFETHGIDLPNGYGEVPFFLVWTRGDGQVFVALAADPLARGPAADLADLDYRFGRIGFAWLGWLVSLGQQRFIPVALFSVNVMALGLMGAMVANAEKRLGRRALLALLNPALYLGFAGDTAETVAVVAATGAVLAEAGWIRLGASAILGTFRSELLTVVPMARARVAKALMVGASTSALVRAIGVALAGYWSGSAGALGLPMAGYLVALQRNDPLTSALMGAFLAVVLATLYEGLRHRSGWPRAAFVSTSLLLLCLTPKMLEDSNVLRVAGALPLLWAFTVRRSADFGRPIDKSGQT
jgi:hypothetical protein